MLVTPSHGLTSYQPNMITTPCQSKTNVSNPTVQRADLLPRAQRDREPREDSADRDRDDPVDEQLAARQPGAIAHPGVVAVDHDGDAVEGGDHSERHAENRDQEDGERRP